MKKLRWRIEYDKNNYLSQVFVCFLFQIVIVRLILTEQVKCLLTITIESNDITLNFARFVAIMVMHTYVLDEIQNGMKMQKFAINHWWKFKYPGYAFLAGLLQTVAMYNIAIVNIFVVM